MATEAEVARLRQIRIRHEDASRDWTLSRDGKQLFGRLMPGTEPVPVLDLRDECGFEDRDFFLAAHADVAFLLQLVSRAAREIKRLRPREASRQQPAKPRDYAAECAMKCADRLFIRYLVERHDLAEGASEQQIATRIRSILVIDSRAQLNTEEDARNGWLELRANFEAWKANP